MLEIFKEGWFGSVVGIIGIIVGCLLYIRSMRTAKPSFQKFSLMLLGVNEGELPAEVTVLFQDKKIERLTRTTLIFWNNGTDVLYGEKIVKDDEIKISFDSGNTILDQKVLKTTKKANAFSTRMESNKPHQLVVAFSYLDPGDGAAVELLHNSEKRYPKVHGSIMGLPKGFEDLGRVYEETFLSTGALSFFGNRRVLFWVLIVVGVGFATAGALPPEYRQILRAADTDAPVSWTMIGFGLLYAAMPVLLLWLRRRRYPKSLRIE